MAASSAATLANAPRRMRFRRDLREEALDQIEPGGARRREVQMEAWMLGEPGLHRGRLVRPVVVDHQMQGEVLRRRIPSINLRKAMNSRARCRGLQSPMTRPVLHVEGGIERRRAVALVVVRHRRRAALLQRQAGLRAVEGLDLALLIDTQHQRAIRRVHVEPHDIRHLLLEMRVVGDLELLYRCGLRPASAQMRCTLVRLMPISPAIVRTLQCVASGGVSLAVLASTLRFTAAVSGVGPDGRVLSRRKPIDALAR